MRLTLTLILLLFSSVSFAQALTDTYITELESNIELLEELIANGHGTPRDEFMLNYYRDKLAESKAAATGGGNRVAFTTNIDNREPVDNLTDAEGMQSLYFFSELRNLTGKRVIHRWVYNGEVVLEQGFNVGASRWRVWSQKNVAEYAGPVTVEIVSEGQVLQTAVVNVR